VAAIITPSSLRRMPSAFKCLINALAGQVARNIRAAAVGPPEPGPSMLRERARQEPGATQEEAHHRKMSFDEEFLASLRKHGVAFDPKFVFVRPRPVEPSRTHKLHLRRCLELRLRKLTRQMFPWICNPACPGRI